MTHLFPIFSLMVMAAGWHYLFYSNAAAKLAEVEDPQTNRRRVRLRRMNGFVMLALGVDVLSAYLLFGQREASLTELMLWTLALVLLFFVMVLALIDIRLTAALRRRKGPPI